MSPRRRQFGAVRRLPSGRWQASYVGADGLRRGGPQTFPTKADASAWLSLRHAELVRGEWLNPDLGRVPFGGYASRWVAEHRLSLRTRDLYETLLRLHIAPFLGDAALAAITPEGVRTWRANLLTSGRSEGTTAKAYRLLRAILNTAVADGRIRVNPCRIKGADTSRSKERPVATVAQVFALADAIGEQYRAMVLTAALTGMRWGELVALRRSDIDLDARVIHVRRSLVEHKGLLVEAPPKWDSVRVITLPALLVDELQAHMDARVDTNRSALVFTGVKGATPRRGNWRGVVKWNDARTAAGLPEGFHFHDLRHTGNHLVAQAGASTRELMDRMGHSTIRAALVYQHATEERAHALAARLNTLVAAQATGGRSNDVARGLHAAASGLELITREVSTDHG